MITNLIQPYVSNGTRFIIGYRQLLSGSEVTVCQKWLQMTPQSAVGTYWTIEKLIKTKFIRASIDGIGRTFPSEGDRRKLINFRGGPFSR